MCRLEGAGDCLTSYHEPLETSTLPAPQRPSRIRSFRRIAFLLALTAALAFTVVVWRVVLAPTEPTPSPYRIDDVTQLNPVQVSAVLTPTRTEDIVAAVRGHAGPISVGGARHSMGGQTAAAGSLHIDMRRFNRVVAFSRADKTITVQAGATWRQILEHIDSSDLSVDIMQSYANFTVGGSLSVNAHGRTVGRGPVSQSVESLELVLADGTLVAADCRQGHELCSGAIGGYGGLGVITHATLRLTDNVRLKRHDLSMPLSEYPDYFAQRIRSWPEVVFHNADIYPDDYDVVRAITYARTTAAVTVPDRLRPAGKTYRSHRLAYWVLSEWPFGNAIRQYVTDPVMYVGEPVTWRNYEMSYDTSELEPASRSSSTYALQEYFVPIDRFGEFIGRLQDVLRRHDVNVINVSVRHAERDSKTVLAWARAEVFGFVIYYKQGTSPAAQQEVGVWTRELIEAALNAGGTYYLPYQLHATDAQFRRAYPGADAFLALKKRLDPANKFRNGLLDRYFRH